MKTIEQVLTEFARMQRQISDNGFDGSCDLRLYQSAGYWSVRISRVTFTDECDVKTMDDVEWEHFSHQNGYNEEHNEQKVEEFKKKFNLK